jgi:hypothetical protein
MNKWIGRIESSCEVERAWRKLSGVVGEAGALSHRRKITWLIVDPSLSTTPSRRKVGFDTSMLYGYMVLSRTPL